MKNDRHNPPTLVYSHGNDGHPTVSRVGKKRARRERTVGEITPWHTRLLNALQGRQVFAGIDPDEDPAAANRLAKRRRRNRLAKASRKINRR
ncbi:hypothetical protein [Microbacterium sp.]|jgi:hypothetical protein|uniref:hypothetical protein n=1 Tax=Microbacterium sp. TaxID=51671 RepID=UPI0037C6E397